MRRSWIPLVAAAVCGVMAVSPSATSAFPGARHDKKHDEKKEVEQMEEQWRTAQLSGDVATMKEMLADDFIGISMSGEVNTKLQLLDHMRTRKLQTSKMELSDTKMKLVGDAVAIVTSLADVEGISDGTPVKGRFRYTRVYQHLSTGEWKITSFEATRIGRRRGSEESAQQGGTPSPAVP